LLLANTARYRGRVCFNVSASRTPILPASHKRRLPTRRDFIGQSAAAIAATAGGLSDMSDTPLRLGIVGCAEGTHGKVWAEMLAAPGGERFGMRPARVWDADADTAAALAKATGAQAVSDARQAGEDVDGILITELFPDRYLELSRPFLEAGKRVFYNRPFAGSARDAKHILDTASRHSATVYSASALYHTTAGEQARAKLGALGQVRLFNMTGPTDHLGFYLPHAIAALVSVLGTGIVKVQAVSLQPSSANPHLATRPVVVYVEYGPSAACGPARGVFEMVGPGAKWYAFVLKLFGAETEADEVHFEVSYDMLLHKMAEFFRTGVEPVPHDVLLEKTAVYYAALESARRGGRPVNPHDLLRAA
jgi:hypothetical protein